MASKSTAPITDTSSPPAITRCCCSIVREIVRLESYRPATSTAPNTEKNCCGAACETCAVLLVVAGGRHLTQRVFRAMVRKIADLPVLAG
jgi:hypothetical protein